MVAHGRNHRQAEAGLWVEGRADKRLEAALALPVQEQHVAVPLGLLLDELQRANHAQDHAAHVVVLAAVRVHRGVAPPLERRAERNLPLRRPVVAGRMRCHTDMDGAVRVPHLTRVRAEADATGASELHDGRQAPRTGAGRHAHIEVGVVGRRVRKGCHGGAAAQPDIQDPHTGGGIRNRLDQGFHRRGVHGGDLRRPEGVEVGRIGRPGLDGLRFCQNPQRTFLRLAALVVQQAHGQQAPSRNGGRLEREAQRFPTSRVGADLVGQSIGLEGAEHLTAGERRGLVRDRDRDSHRCAAPVDVRGLVGLERQELVRSSGGHEAPANAQAAAHVTR